MEHILNFTGSPKDNADDQMLLSTALATAVGTLENIESSFVDELPFQVFWERGFIHFETGGETLQLSQPEALQQAASLRQAALDGGATVL